MKDFQNIENIIKNFRTEKSWEQRLIYSKIIDLWNEALGFNIAKQIKITKIENGTVFVSTESSVWKTELYLKKPSIIDFLNTKLESEFGKECIKDMIIR